MKCSTRPTEKCTRRKLIARWTDPDLAWLELWLRKSDFELSPTYQDENFRAIFATRAWVLCGRGASGFPSHGGNVCSAVVPEKLLDCLGGSGLRVQIALG